MKKTLTLALIIPVYNEEKRLKVCLDAIAAQTVMPDEVIIVDNNSTDGSMKIAKRYPFVRIVQEKRQGFTPARNRGFNSAHSDILGRIDVDSVIDPNWTKSVEKVFADKSVSGATGPGVTGLLPRMHRPSSAIWSQLYFFWQRKFYGVPVLWGANMAVRRTAWQQIKNDVCPDDRIVHEDHDISLLLLHAGGKLVYNSAIRMRTNTQTYHFFPKLMTYTRRRHTTRAYHRGRGTYIPNMSTAAWLWRGLLYILWSPMFLVFYSISFITWPLDALMHQLGRTSWMD